MPNPPLLVVRANQFPYFCQVVSQLALLGIRACPHLLAQRSSSSAILFAWDRVTMPIQACTRPWLLLCCPPGVYFHHGALPLLSLCAVLQCGRAILPSGSASLKRIHTQLRNSPSYPAASGFLCLAWSPRAPSGFLMWLLQLASLPLPSGTPVQGLRPCWGCITGLPNLM